MLSDRHHRRIPGFQLYVGQGSSTINSIVFTTTNGKYAAILTAFITKYAAIPTEGSPLTPLYTIAKAVNSNISAADNRTAVRPLQISGAPSFRALCGRWIPQLHTAVATSSRL